MKKRISILVLLAFVAAGAFAQRVGMSVGGGLLFDYSANNGVSAADYYAGIRNSSFGGFIFFDATYAEVDVSFARGNLTSVYEKGNNSGTADMGSAMQLGFSLLGKYPVRRGYFTFFPLLGVNYNVVLSGSDPDGNKFDKPGNLSQFGIQGGAGMDYNLTHALYLRGEALFQLRLASKTMNDAATGDTSTTLGMGPVVKVALGYRF